MAKKDREEYKIHSVCQALNLLEQFRGDPCELRLADLARLLRTSNNHVLRLLVTLASRNFVEKNEQTGAYRLGMTTFTLSRSCLGNKRLLSEGRPALEELASATGETVFLAVLENGAMVYADCLESPLAVRAVATRGTRFPLHSTAAGKLILAHVEKARAGLDTESNGAGGAEDARLSGQLEEIRDRGYALDLGEYQRGLCGVAAPVRDHTSRVIAAVGIVGPDSRLDAERMALQLAKLVMEAGLRVSVRMGYEPGSEQTGAATGATTGATTGAATGAGMKTALTRPGEPAGPLRRERRQAMGGR